MRKLFLAAAALLLTFGTQATAGDVTVSGVHLCCGACGKAIEAAFADVEGVTNLAVDKDAQTVKFSVEGEEGLKTGLQTLAKAGFAGTVKHGDDEVAFPGSNRKKGETGNEFTVRGLHNCCGGCAKAIEGALKGVEGVSEVSINKRIAKVTGSDVSEVAIIKALHAAGLHGNIPKEKKDKDE